MRRLVPALLASLLLTACSSGGEGTSGSGAGIAGINAGATGITLFATLSPENFSSDTVPSDCTIPPDGVIDQRIESDFGTATINARDNAVVATNTNKGIVFTSYTVSYKGVTAGAPALQSRAHGVSIPLFLGNNGAASASSQVVLVELDTTKPEFNAKNAAGKVYTYTVTVTFRGTRTDTNQAVSVSASTAMELGNFCEGD